MRIHHSTLRVQATRRTRRRDFLDESIVSPEKNGLREMTTEHKENTQRNIASGLLCFSAVYPLFFINLNRRMPHANSRE
jgi:hypothetical protein